MKILISTKNWLGDVIFETPAIRVIKRNFPDSEIVCATVPRCEEIVKRNPCVNRVVIFDERSTHKSFGAKLKFVSWLRREKFDKVFLLHRSFTRAFLAFLGGARERVGYATKGRGLILTKSIPDDREDKHRVYYFLDLLKKAGLRVDVDPYCEFLFSQEDDNRACRLLSDKGLDLSRLVALNPGGNRANKRWPFYHFARLADLLAERYKCSLVITGSSQDDALATDMIHATRRAKPVSLCGDTGLGDLGAVFSRCRLVISGDSGPLHIAAGVGANVLALFGPTDPRLFGPMGKGKNIVIKAELHKGSSMESIDPIRVMDIIDREKLL